MVILAWILLIAAIFLAGYMGGEAKLAEDLDRKIRKLRQENYTISLKYPPGAKIGKRDRRRIKVRTRSIKFLSADRRKARRLTVWLAVGAAALLFIGGAILVTHWENAYRVTVLFAAFALAFAAENICRGKWYPVRIVQVAIFAATAIAAMPPVLDAIMRIFHQ